MHAEGTEAVRPDTWACTWLVAVQEQAEARRPASGQVSAPATPRCTDAEKQKLEADLQQLRWGPAHGLTVSAACELPDQAQALSRSILWACTLVIYILCFRVRLYAGACLLQH